MLVFEMKRALLLRNSKARRGQESIDPLLQRLAAGGLNVTVETFEALPELVATSCGCATSLIW